MNKDNQFRSSLFHMSQNDVLHILVIDESGTPLTVTLNTQYADGTNNEDEYPSNPVAIAASDVLSTSFTANWYFAENALGYYLDVAIDSAFTTYVAGYENLDVSNVDEYSIVGLTEDTDYYYRLRAYNTIGAGSYSNTITLTTEIGNALVDKSGNIYTTVTIGTQKWIIENFRSLIYSDNAAITNITVDATWAADTTGAYCWYDNDIANKAAYGALYNHYALQNASGLSYLERGGVEETEWRLPTETDFNTLVAYLGGTLVAGGKLKEIGLEHWLTPNTGATNESGFTGVGTGYRDVSGSIGVTYIHPIWSSTEEFGVQAVYLLLDRASASLSLNSTGGAYSSGMSVRLVQDIPLAGLADKDGNIYTTVVIGTQEWTIENLKTTTYADDAAIVNITDAGTWAADTTGAYCWYDNDEATYGEDYGALYNWHAVDNASGLAYLERDGVQEAGWRVPTSADFATLSAYLGGDSVAGGKLKEVGTTHWDTPNTGATDEFEFKSLPNGYRFQNGSFYFNGQRSYVYTSTAVNATEAMGYVWYYNDIILSPNNGSTKEQGQAIRLVKDV